MHRMTLLGRLGVALAAGFVLLPSPAFAGSDEGSTVTLPSSPTLVAPTLTTPTLVAPQPPAASTTGSLTVPTISVPQLQVPTISVPQLQVPTISVPQLQVPTLTVPPLVAPELPTLTAAQPMAVTANTVQATPRRGRQDSTRGTSTNVTPQAVGLVSPETLLGMLRVQQENAAVELVAPQEATTTDRLPIGTFAAFGGGVALVSFALSLLRRREETRSPADAG